MNTKKHIFFQYAHTCILLLWGETVSLYMVPIAMNNPGCASAVFIKKVGILSVVWQAGLANSCPAA